MKFWNNYINCFIAIFVVSIYSSFAATLASPPQRPNVIYINVDDLGYKDLGFMGSQFYETPHIDRLAQESMVFTQAYAAAANCAPSRACLMSGLNTPQHGIYTVENSDRGDIRTRKIIPIPNQTVLADSIYTLAEMFSDNGYVTGTFGKWHLGDDPTTQGFQVNVGGNDRGNPGKDGYFSPYNLEHLPDGPEGEYLTDRLTTEAISFLRAHQDSAFFLYLPYYTVHTPIMGKDSLVQKFEQKQGSNGQHHPEYAAMIASLDENVGRLLAEVEDLNIENNTLIIFTSDNGGIRAISHQDPLRAGKGSYYEGGIRVPLVIRWPGKIAAGSRCKEPVSNLDFYPTLQTIIGAPHTSLKLDGDDITPLLQGKIMPERTLHWHFPIYLQAYEPGEDGGRDPLFRTRPGSVIRQGDWKLHQYYEDNTLELYNLKKDVGETRNLVEEYPEKAQALHRLLQNWLERMQAPIPKVENPDYDAIYEQKQQKAATFRPNILWVVADDLGTDLGCYGDSLVHTPHLDLLAQEGVLYRNAFTVTAVCSPSRSALITGMYPVSINAHQHRTQYKDSLPDPVVPVTEYFKEAGYFVSNGNARDLSKYGKTDYNFIHDSEQMYGGTDWRQRAQGQPFFAQVQIFYPHRPFQRDPSHPVDADRVELPPYYPDHPVARQDWALYLETVQQVDKEVGHILQRLEDDGLADSTIVFFFGDQGRPHVRAKQFMYDGGIHTPLIIRWPGYLKAGTEKNRLVSNIDLAPTAMRLAGISIPDYMQGRGFLSEKAEPRAYVFAMRDRRDETVDRIRAVRTQDFKYIRNFYPERPYTQFNAYKKQAYPVLTLMQVMQKRGQLTPEQARFMAPTRPAEELYDLRKDPHELYNLAEQEAYQDKVEELRIVLNDWLAEADQGQYPEDSSEIIYAQQLMENLFKEQMEKKGLSLDISDEDFLKYWEKELTPTQPE